MATAFEKATNCVSCDKKFSFLTCFKFPCTACGQAYCKNCSNNFVHVDKSEVLENVDSKRKDFNKPQRLCDPCLNRITEKRRASQRPNRIQVSLSFEDRYTIGEKLGEGAFGVVMAGISNGDQRPVAIKMVSRDKMSPDEEQALHSEVSILFKLHHPNIVQIFDFMEEPTKFNIVMEQIAGGELFDRIVQKECYTEKAARDLTLIVLHAIKYLHDRNVVHRDLKPENLLLTSKDDDADVKIVDFGFATIAEGNTLEEQVGTPGYVAPEIIRAVPYGKACDMFSFGVILFILLSGCPPFYDKDQEKIFRNTVKGNYEFNPLFWSSISDEAKDLVRGLLDVNQDSRITVDQALAHPWILQDSNALESRNLDANLVELRRFQAAKRWKKGIHAVIAMNKFKARASLPNIQVEIPRTVEARYNLGPVLGEGGYAVVKKAVSKLTNQEVAVKIVEREKLNGREEFSMRREVKMLLELSHPNVVKAYDFLEDAEKYYIVMELITGGELFDRIIKKTQYDECTARDLAVIFLSALQYLHHQDIAHRDLKPENLLLTSETNDADIKIVDFGFAAKTNGSTLEDQCGTPGYIAPEVILNQKYGTSVDMWAFGVILFILLAGYPPFYGNSNQLVFRKITRGEYQFHEQYWQSVSEEAKDLIRHLLVVNPAERYTVDQALQHPWLRLDADQLRERNLATGLCELRKFQARRKLRAGIKAIIGLGRMGMFTQQLKQTKQEDETRI